MIRKISLAIGVTALISGAASAQGFIIGSGLGKNCYDATVQNLNPTADDEQVCTIAIKSTTLNYRDLTATYVNRGIIRMRMQDFDGALADYQKAKRNRPSFGEIYLNEGAALIGMGDALGAIESIETSLSLGTSAEHVAHYNLGLAYELEGNASEAYRNYRIALEKRPDWALPEEQLARFTVVQGES